MNILLVAENSILPAVRYGGMQRVVWHLAQALHALGHKVYIICAECSECSFAEIIIRNKAVALEKQVPEDVDIVHFHSEIPAGFSRPFVETIHGNYNKSFCLNSIFLSANHAARFGSNVFVYNGLNWDDYGTVDLSLPRQNYHFLGKASWRVKNVDGAISVAKKLKDGAKLDVLGGKRFNLHMGWRMTFSRHIVFHGMSDDAEKKQVMTRSRGLIFPVVWHEPFGLAAIESLYCGAPVFSTPYGALAEIVIPEVGCLATSLSDMVQQIEGANFSAQKCHDYVVETFSAERMARGYIEKYESVLNGHNLNDKVPAHIENEVKPLWLNK